MLKPKAAGCVCSNARTTMAELTDAAPSASGNSARCALSETHLALWQALEASATVNGQRQTDYSRRIVNVLHDDDPHTGILLVAPNGNQATLNVAYLLSVPKRRSWIASHLMKLCGQRFGLACV